MRIASSVEHSLFEESAGFICMIRSLYVADEMEEDQRYTTMKESRRVSLMVHQPHAQIPPIWRIEPSLAKHITSLREPFIENVVFDIANPSSAVTFIAILFVNLEFQHGTVCSGLHQTTLSFYLDLTTQFYLHL